MKFYIQRCASGYVGNCILWWRKGGAGYTTNLDDAEVFDESDEIFLNIVKDRGTFVAWEIDYTNSCAHRHVDHQNINSCMAYRADSNPTHV